MFAYSAGIGPFCSGMRWMPFIAYIISPLGNSACIEEYVAPDPSSRGSIIMWLTGGLKGAPGGECQHRQQQDQLGGTYLDVSTANLLAMANFCWENAVPRVLLLTGTRPRRPSLGDLQASQNIHCLTVRWALVGYAQQRQPLPAVFGCASAPVKSQHQHQRQHRCQHQCGSDGRLSSRHVWDSTAEDA
jgi:hypothetical protein